MDILTRWDTSQLEQSKKIHDLLRTPPEELVSILPPILDNMDTVLQKRREYIENAIERNKLAEAMKTSHQRRKAPPSALTNISQLKENNAFLIIAGQQPGILTGPLYTFYKIIHAIVLAKNLTENTPHTFLPAYWNASEDHDFQEISTLWWLSTNNTLESYTWPGSNDSRRPYYCISPDEFPLDELIEWIKTNFRETEFLDPVLETISECHQPADSYPDFVDGLIWRLFPESGLIILRPDDPYVYENQRTLMKEEIESPRQTSHNVSETAELLSHYGHKISFHKRKDRTSFFLIENQARVPLFTSNGSFDDDRGNTYSADDLLFRLEHNPQSFSSSAVLRPIIQDALFPNVATILGPGELAYHLLLHSIYETHEVPRPPLVPRLGFTILENRDLRLLDKHELNPMDLRQDPAALIKTLTREQDQDNITQNKETLDDQVNKFFEKMIQKAQSVDPTIVKVLKKNKGKIQKEIGQSENLLRRREADKNEVTRNHLESLHDSLFPENDLQERRLNIFYYLTKYGFDLIKDFESLCTNLTPGSHHFVKFP